MKRPALTILFLLFLLCSLSAASEPATEAEVHLIKVEGVINPVMSEYIGKGIEEAEKGASALVIQLDTPGGLDPSMRDIVKAILSSRVPVVVHVAPSGARAASAGVFITYAAHIAAMAPGTNIGSAHPVPMGGGEMDEVMMKKIENDAVAYIKSIATKRGRNAEWAEKAVRESVNITSREALKLGVIDLMADSTEELLEKIDSKKVETEAGTITLKTKGATVKEIDMGLRLKILNAISNPNVAYILMMIGLVGLYFELSNPGTIFPGVIGAICLILAFYAFQTLPVNYAGLALIGLSLIFFIAETQVTSFGLLAIGGVISLILGSLMLFESPLPFMRVSMGVLLPTVIMVSLSIIVIMYYAVRLHKKRPVSGMEGLIGEEGVVVERVSEKGGRIFVDGEYWYATADEPIEKDAKVRVVAVKGFRLKVERIKEDEQ